MAILSDKPLSVESFRYFRQGTWITEKKYEYALVFDMIS